MSLQQEIEHAINRASAESGSDTPDFILAQYLMGCLAAWNRATKERERWYGRGEKVTAPAGPTGPATGTGPIGVPSINA